MLGGSLFRSKDAEGQLKFIGSSALHQHEGTTDRNPPPR